MGCGGGRAKTYLPAGAIALAFGDQSQGWHPGLSHVVALRLAITRPLDRRVSRHGNVCQPDIRSFYRTGAQQWCSSLASL